MIESSSVKIIDHFIDLILEHERPENYFNPNLLAEYFLSIFEIKYPIKKSDIIEIAYQFGIDNITAKKFPYILRGANESTIKTKKISLRNGLKDETFSFTLLHEIYELICFSIAKRMEIDYIVDDANSNDFSASVLMPKCDFFNYAVFNYFDPHIILKKYNLNPFSVIIRMKKVLNEHNISFLGLRAIHKSKVFATNKNYIKYGDFCILSGSYSRYFNEDSYLRIFKCIFPDIYYCDNFAKTISFAIKLENIKDKIQLIASPIFDSSQKIKEIILFAIPYNDYLRAILFLFINTTKHDDFKFEEIKKILSKSKDRR